MPDSASRATVRGEQSWLRRPIPTGHNIKNKRKKIQLEMGRNTERGDTTATQHPSASRTRLPILIAAWLFIIAATVTMSSGLPGVVQAEPQHSGYYEMYGTVNFEGNGSLSVNVRGRFGQTTWGTWSPTGSLYCYTTEKPSSN